MLSLLLLLAAGTQLTEGPQAMASTPALPAAEAQKRFTVPAGFEVRLFAAEPQIVNPVAMTWDERGRLWVVELYQYPKKAPPGEKGKDRIKILEDTDNDGRADKVTMFADGLNLATGIARYRGGVLVGQAPDLLYLEDTNGDDIADKRTVMLTGFGLQDTHELLNGFSWGPDGWLYMTHGVFTQSKVTHPDGGEEVAMNAALARYQPEQKKFEVFADGTSNAWGVDFDRAGNAFVSACVIDHLFHLSPGGVYVRQAGSPGDPYAYDLLPSIVEHKHFRAAYAGVQIYQGDQYPPDYRGMIVMGNIHGNSLNRDRLIPAGATFRAEPEADFLKSSDPWFRPVTEQVGPDGNLWIADWYDKYPCYQNARADPEGVDRTYGRIWRVVHGGTPRGTRRAGQKDLARLTTSELVVTLADANVWHRRVAQRLLSERKDASARQPLLALVTGGNTLESRLAALWALHGSGLLDDGTLDKLASDVEPAVRTWTARFSEQIPRLEKLASDADPTVRAGVAVALRRMTGLSTDAALIKLAGGTGPSQGPDKTDRTLSFLIWRALEPRVARDAAPFLAWAQNNPDSAELVRRTMRRLYDTGDLSRIEQAAAFLGQTKDARLVTAALEGLLEGQAGQTVRPRAAAMKVVRPLLGHPEPKLAAAARRLGAVWGDPQAAEAILKVIRDPKAGEGEKAAAIGIAASIPTPAARKALLAAFAQPGLAAAAIRALGKAGVEGTPEEVVRSWKKLPSATRTAAVDVMAARPKWAQALLAAVESKAIPALDVPLSVQRAMGRDPALRPKVEAVFGKMRESSADARLLIAAKKQLMLHGPVDFADGQEKAKAVCLLCHKFYGEGGDVGPDLTGVGRATLDALLANVIDPNQVIGKGYEQVTVVTKDGRTVSGRLVEDTSERVTLVGLNLRETIPRGQIASLQVAEVSVMPEGLENMPDQSFRNLLWYIYQPPQDPTSKLRVELKDKRMQVLTRGADGKSWVPLLDYVMDPALRPYIHPLRDPGGKNVLTDDKPGDHPWQHGIFTGLHKVNGVDFWSEKQGRQRFVRLTDLQQETDRVLWKALVEWVTPSGEVILEEEQAITVYAPSPDGYSIDFDWTLKTKNTAVTLGKYDYGGLSVRMPLHKDHTHLNASGDKHKAANTRRAAWATVARPFDDGSTWGVAVLDHPGNDRHPAAWRVDAQGMISPSNSIQGDWSIPEWRSKQFRYRLVVFRDAASDATLTKELGRFAAVPFVAGR